MTNFVEKTRTRAMSRTDREDGRMDQTAEERRELLCLQTQTVRVTLQGAPAPCGAAGLSALQVFCREPYRLSLHGLPQPAAWAGSGTVRFGAYTPPPLLTARRVCLLTVTPARGHTAAFRCRELWRGSGVSGQADEETRSFRLCPGSAPGLAELTVEADGAPLLRMLLEIVPARPQAETLRLADDAAQTLCGQVSALLDHGALARRLPDGPDEAALAVVQELTAGLLRETELLPPRPVGPLRSGGGTKRPSVRSGRYTLPESGLGEAAMGAPTMIYNVRRSALPLQAVELAGQELAQLQRRLRPSDRQSAGRLDALRRQLSARQAALEGGQSTAADVESGSLPRYLALLEQSRAQRESMAAAGETARLRYACRRLLGMAAMAWELEPDGTLTEDFAVRDVLVGCLRSREQLETCLRTCSYHIPAARLSPELFPIRCVAIYQSPRFFAGQAGVRHYGTVTACTLVRRGEIPERPRASDEPYYRFTVASWRQLETPVAPQGMDRVCGMTNLFQLRHSPDMTGLWLRTASELRLYLLLCRAVQQAEANGGSREAPLRVGGSQLVLACGTICIVRGGRTREAVPIEEFRRAPGPVFGRLCRRLLALQAEG